MLTEWFLSVLAAAAVALLIFAARRCLYTPVRLGDGLRLELRLSAGAGSSSLEEGVRSLRELLERGGLRCDIVIVDSGMDGEARETARLLSRRYDNVVLADGVEEEWRKKRNT